MTVLIIAALIGAAAGIFFLYKKGTASVCADHQGTSDSRASACNCGVKCQCGLNCTCAENCACAGKPSHCGQNQANPTGSPCACSAECACVSSCACGERCLCGSAPSKSALSPRTIEQLLNQGINSVDDLKEALQVAIQLEFSTIPPYLCAEWSIKDQNHPACSILHEIVMQEMLHFGLASNMLAAIGGKPALANSGFMVKYPTLGLPGNVHPTLKVDLLPLSAEALDTFMAIELPENPLAVTKDVTIGAFYDAIADAFRRLQPTIVASHQATHPVGNDELFAIASVEDALKAINLIKEQGEGTSESALVTDYDPDQPAHYYALKQLAVGRGIVKGADGKWHFDGPAIQMPQTHGFQASANAADTSVFSKTFSDVLGLLEKTWSDDPMKLHTAMMSMFQLRKQGMSLIALGIRPDFVFVETTIEPDSSRQ